MRLETRVSLHRASDRVTKSGGRRRELRGGFCAPRDTGVSTPDLLNSGNPADRPRWMDSWVHFVAELQSTFGPHDPVADAEHQLEHLRMKDLYHVTRYIVDFNRLASQVQDYGDGALHCLFYSGLPDRLKDEIARVGKPLTVTTVTSDHPVPYYPIASTRSPSVYCMYSLFRFSLSVL